MIPQEQKTNLMIKGKGTPVLLLHSALSSKIQWFQLMESMSRDYLMVAVDLSGYGGAPFPANQETFSLSHEVAWVESVLAGVVSPGESIHLVGHSYGGAVGLRFCYKNPERIRSLTLFEPVAFHLLPETEEALTRVRRMIEVADGYIKQEKYDAAAEYFVDYWSAPGTFSSYPGVIRRTFCAGIKKLHLDFRALVGEPLSLEDYGKIERPVCLIAGKQSPIDSRRVSELLAEHLPDCRLNWITGNHMAPLFRSDQVNPIIGAFIRRMKR